MTGLELHQFFHFDTPPYLVILLLSINIAVIVNKCDNWSFLLLWGQKQVSQRNKSAENVLC